MNKRDIFLIFGLTLLGVLSITMMWEFVLEDTAWASIDAAYREEAIGEHWEYVITTLIFVTIALLLPIWLALRVNERRKSAEQALGKSEMFNRTVLSSLTENIAVLDSSGTIVAVNEAWERFARENDNATMVNSDVGVNYLEVCRQATGPFSEQAYKALDGIQSVLGGRRPLFTLEYACHSPEEKRWFLMTVSPMSGGDGGVVTHINITEREQLNSELRQAKDAAEQASALPIFTFLNFSKVPISGFQHTIKSIKSGFPTSG